MAIGVACAGSGATNKAALEILMPMLEDKESFVRQGALMATSLVLMQENEKRCASVKTLRAKIISVIEDKHQSIVAKFGAVVGAGILDAGGRNMCVALTSRTGFLRRGAVVGMMVWLNHWYWHPLLNFFSMALTPTAIIGVNKDMKMPEKFTLNCLSKPSLFAYPKALEEAKEEVKERVKTAVLSTTASKLFSYFQKREFVVCYYMLTIFYFKFSFLLTIFFFFNRSKSQSKIKNIINR